MAPARTDRPRGLRPLSEVAAELGLDPEDWVPYGRGKAKVPLEALDRPAKGRGDIVLVSAITPTPAGEGKTTTSVALAMGLSRIGVRSACALREPSLGPVFGVKGGGTGGGRAQLEPASDINLHFTGDLHAITAANNLLAALVDNELHFASTRSQQGSVVLDPRRISVRRAIDMNDRALRNVVIGLGGRNGGVPRETGFDITAASEVMAVLCLSESMDDLVARLSRIVVGRTYDQKPVTAGDLSAGPAMAALLRDALLPNLVQTSEGSPAFVHGGPFANIAHGCSSVLATRMAMHHADVVVTEGGFGFDLGAEKFLDIKCRSAGIWPRAVVLVATLRALKFHGGVSPKDAAAPNREALARGIENLERHLESARGFGLPAVVAINAWSSDTEEEIELVRQRAAQLGAPVALSRAFEKGGEGALELAETVMETLSASARPTPRFTYPLEASYFEKIESVAKNVYGADGLDCSARARRELESFSRTHPGLPVCIAKTHLSVSDDASLQGRPRGFRVTVQDARLSAGAGFVVALLGDIMTMPGLPSTPAAHHVRILDDGSIHGLMQSS